MNTKVSRFKVIRVQGTMRTTILESIATRSEGNVEAMFHQRTAPEGVTYIVRPM